MGVALPQGSLPFGQGIDLGLQLGAQRGGALFGVLVRFADHLEQGDQRAGPADQYGAKAGEEGDEHCGVAHGFILASLFGKRKGGAFRRSCRAGRRAPRLWAGRSGSGAEPGLGGGRRLLLNITRFSGK